MSTPSKLARAMDPRKAQSVTITLNAAKVEIVNRLYLTGLWGGTPAETVRRLFDEALKPHVPV